MLNMILNHPALGRYDLGSVRDCEYGASPMPDALLVDLMKKLSSWRFHQGYGLTECAALACLLPWKYHALEGPIAEKRKSAGRAAAGVEIRIVDSATGKELPRNTVGEIAIRGAGVMLGYWRKPEETERALRNGWLHTGDGARMDEDGFVYIVDRVKDMINRGGENVYCVEVENALAAAPGVFEVAVLGVPDTMMGEKVGAIVVPTPGPTFDRGAFLDHARAHLADFKVPQYLVVRSEVLPRNPGGKVLKSTLREHAEWGEPIR
jgi:long-chain acyl-CoA synthetase